MNKIKIIGLTGKARAGKDTVANIIHSYMTQHTDMTVNFEDTYVLGLESFAAPIKSMVAMLLDFFAVGSIQQPTTLQPYIDGDKKEEIIDVLKASPRKLMQTLGTEWGRNLISDSIWIDSMKARIGMYKHAIDHGHAGALVVCTDTRFDNEAEALTSMGGVIVEVVRDEAPEVAEHASEGGIDSKYITITIFNNGSIEDLVEEVQKKLVDYLPELTEEPFDDGDVDGKNERMEAHS